MPSRLSFSSPSLFDVERGGRGRWVRITFGAMDAGCGLPSRHGGRRGIIVHQADRSSSGGAPVRTSD